MKKRKGQGILEYVIVLTAIIAVIIIAATGVITPSVTTVFDNTGAVIDKGSETLLTGTGAG
jgi:Flp pilus assembly pilin Flp